MNKIDFIEDAATSSIDFQEEKPVKKGASTIIDAAASGPQGIGSAGKLKALVDLVKSYSFGPLGRGNEAAKQGATAADIPGVLTRAGSDILGGAPERIADRPKDFAIGGAPGVQATAFQNKSNPLNIALSGLTGTKLEALPPEKNRLPYPRPVTEAGEKLATETGLIASVGVDIPAAFSTKAGQRAISAIGNEMRPTRVGLDSLKARQADLAIDEAISKGIRPTVTGKNSFSQSQGYFQKAREAVKAIVENEPNLKIVDQYGELKPGLPESLNEFSQAIDQLKQKTFQEYDALARQAGDQGLALDLSPIADDIQKQVGSKAIRTLYPELEGYGLDLADRLRTAQNYTPAEAQEAIELLNSELKAFYRNPNPSAASKAVLDAAIASKLRNALDNTIESATGESYKMLKNRYGALRSIQEDVTKRAIVEGRKNYKGFFDLADIISNGDIVKGLATLNPADIAKGMLQKRISAHFKILNNPNNIVRDMFKKVKRYHVPTITAREVKPPVRMLEGPANRGLLEGPQPSKMLGVSDQFGEGFERLTPQQSAKYFKDRLEKMGDALNQIYRKALPHPANLGEGFERVPREEAMKRLQDFAFKFWSPTEKKVIIPAGGANSEKTKTLLKAMGIDPFTGEIKSPLIKSAFQMAWKRAKRG